MLLCHRNEVWYVETKSVLAKDMTYLHYQFNTQCHRYGLEAWITHTIYDLCESVHFSLLVIYKKCENYENISEQWDAKNL